MVTLVALRAHAGADRSGRGDFLARLCTAHARSQMGAERGFPFGHAALCLGARWVMQFHVGNGRVGGRLRVGRDISFLSEMLSGHCGVSCLVGCCGLHLVSHLTRCFPFQSFLSTYCVWDKDMCAPPTRFFPVGALLSYCDSRKNLSSTKSYRDTMTYIAPRFYKWGMRKTQFGELTLNTLCFLR